MPAEEGIVPVQGDAVNGAFDGIGVELDAAVGQEATQTVFLCGDVGEGLAQLRVCGRAGAMVAQPVVQARIHKLPRINVS